jgi:hypothetical protein
VDSTGARAGANGNRPDADKSRDPKRSTGHRHPDLDEHAPPADEGAGPLFEARPERITRPGITAQELLARGDQRGLVLALLMAGPLTEDVARAHGIGHLASRISELRSIHGEPITPRYRREATARGRPRKVAVYWHDELTPGAREAAG